MSLHNQSLQSNARRMRSGTPACSPSLHPGARQGRTLVDASRSSQRPKSTRSAAVGLSTYPLLELRSASAAGSGTLATSSSSSRGAGLAVGSHAWLASCVRHIVKAVGQPGRGPMLQLVFSSRGSGADVAHRFETVPVSQSLADNPTRWSEFSTTVRSSGASGLVLVRPIASPDQHCVYAAAAAAAAPQGQQPPQPAPAACATQCAAAAAAGCTDVGEPRSPFGASPSAAVQPEVEVITGEVGTCCGGDASRPHRPHSTPIQQPQHAHAGAGAAVLAAALPLGRGGDVRGAFCDEGPTRYFGLVVQGSVSSEADGCWVLKTTRSDTGGPPGLCSCTHFSLTRVCLGQPLYSQLRDAWLVG